MDPLGSAEELLLQDRVAGEQEKLRLKSEPGQTLSRHSPCAGRPLCHACRVLLSQKQLHASQHWEEKLSQPVESLDAPSDAPALESCGWAGGCSFYPFTCCQGREGSLPSACVGRGRCRWKMFQRHCMNNNRLSSACGTAALSTQRLFHT